MNFSQGNFAFVKTYPNITTKNIFNLTYNMSIVMI
jgi:hypothetical protein